MKIVDRLTKRVLPVRKQVIQAVVVHTTGDTDLDKIFRFYTSPDGFQPHDVIDYDGTIYRTAPEDVVAYHCKIEDAEARLYQLGWDQWSHWWWDKDRPVNTEAEFPGYAAWKQTWLPLGKRSPLDLVTGDHPNTRSHGIELRQPVKPGPRIFTDAQYKALQERLDDVCGRHGIKMDRTTILGHYDCSPMRRSTKRGGWDPGDAFDWAFLLPPLIS